MPLLLKCTSEPYILSFSMKMSSQTVPKPETVHSAFSGKKERKKERLLESYHEKESCHEKSQMS